MSASLTYVLPSFTWNTTLPPLGTTTAPARIEAYRMGPYRVVVFAAAANDAGSAVDGVIVELP